MVLLFYFDFILINVYIYLNISWWLIYLQLYMNWRVLITNVTLSNSLFNDVIFFFYFQLYIDLKIMQSYNYIPGEPKHTWKWHLYITSLQIYCTLYNDKSTLHVLCNENTLPYTISTLWYNKHSTYWYKYTI